MKNANRSTRRSGAASALIAVMLVLGGCSGKKREFAPSTAASDPSMTDTASGSNTGAPGSEGNDEVVVDPQTEETGANPRALDPSGLPGTSVGAAQSDAGVRIGPVLAAPTTLELGGIVLGGDTTLSLVIRNEGDAALPPMNALLSGENAAEFSVIENACSAELAAGASCVILVRFVPAAAGARAATLVVETATGLSTIIALSGLGLEPGSVTVEAVDEGSSDFGGVLVGASSEQTFRVSNPGDLDAGIIVLGSNNADYEILPPQAGDCESNVTQLASGASCTVRVAFQPAVRGPVNGALTISTDAAGNASFNMTGIGLAPARLVSTVSRTDLGAAEVGTTGTTFNWVVTNGGDVPSPVPVLTGTNGTEFIANNGCAAAIPPGGSCAIDVTFAPRQPGVRSGVLTISGGEGSARLEVSGNARVRLTVVRSGTGSVTSSAGINCGTTCSVLFDVGAEVTLQASTTNGSNAFFSGWSGAECTGPGRACALTMSDTQTVTANFTNMTNNVVFVSSEVFPTNLGGVAPYDAACNRAATAAGINSVGNDAFLAVLSDSTSNVRERISATARGWVRMDGRPFTGTLDELFQSNVVYNAVAFDERGEPVGGANLLEEEVMTGTNSDGTTDMHCANWSTNATGNGTFGLQAGGPSIWVARTRGTCANEYHLFCMMDTRSALLQVPVAAGKRIWTTNTGFAVGGPLTPDQKCASERPAGVANAVALIAYTTRPASFVLQAEASYVRVDGQLVGTGQQLANRQVLTGIWQNADGTYRAPVRSISSVHTGHPTLIAAGTPQSTCNDWTAALGSTVEHIGSTGVINFNWWNRDSIGSCEANAPIYCVEP